MKKETYVQQTNLAEIPYDYPSTWPADGPIDLNIHDLPHDGSLIEWWYQNCHLTSKNGKRLSLFASFFRVAVKEETTGNLNYTHSVIWSLSDIAEKKYYSDSLVDPSTPAEVLKAIKKNEEKNEGSRWIRRALKEVYEKGNMPRPDRLLRQPAKVGLMNLSLEYDENSFKKDQHGNYHLKLENSLNGIVCKLNFIPLTEPIRHGDDGFVSGIRKEEMFYYFIPKCDVSGEIQIGNTVYEVEGSGWYDHEFSKPADGTSTFEFKHEMKWTGTGLHFS